MLTGPWIDAPLAGFDLETTGKDPLTARVVTGCVLAVAPTLHSWHWLLDPGIDIPDEAAAIHGVTTERAQAEGQPYEDGYREIRDRLEAVWAAGMIVAGFNLNYDLTVIDREGLRLGYPELVVGPCADAYVLDRELDKYRRGKRTLSVTCQHYGITLDAAHTADADALAATRLAWKIGRTYPQLADMTVADLMAAQAEWHRARQADFAAYLRRKGEDASTVSGDWPLRRTS